MVTLFLTAYSNGAQAISPVAPSRRPAASFGGFGLMEQ